MVYEFKIKEGEKYSEVFETQGLPAELKVTSIDINIVTPEVPSDDYAEALVRNIVNYIMENTAGDILDNYMFSASFEVDSSVENGVIYIELEGNIDSSNIKDTLAQANEFDESIIDK